MWVLGPLEYRSPLGMLRYQRNGKRHGRRPGGRGKSSMVGSQACLLLLAKQAADSDVNEGTYTPQSVRVDL